MRHWLAYRPSGFSAAALVTTREKDANAYRDAGWDVEGPFAPEPTEEFDRLREIIARASRMAEQERATMTQGILQEAFRCQYCFGAGVMHGNDTEYPTIREAWEAGAWCPVCEGRCYVGREG